MAIRSRWQSGLEMELILMQMTRTKIRQVVGHSGFPWQIPLSAAVR